MMLLRIRRMTYPILQTSCLILQLLVTEDQAIAGARYSRVCPSLREAYGARFTPCP